MSSYFSSPGSTNYVRPSVPGQTRPNNSGELQLDFPNPKCRPADTPASSSRFGEEKWGDAFLRKFEEANTPSPSDEKIEKTGSFIQTASCYPATSPTEKSSLTPAAPLGINHTGTAASTGTDSSPFASRPPFPRR
jgi:hypothetical protein